MFSEVIRPNNGENQFVLGLAVDHFSATQCALDFETQVLAKVDHGPVIRVQPSFQAEEFQVLKNKAQNELSNGGSDTEFLKLLIQDAVKLATMAALTVPVPFIEINQACRFAVHFHHPKERLQFKNVFQDGLSVFLRIGGVEIIKKQMLIILVPLENLGNDIGPDQLAVLSDSRQFNIHGSNSPSMVRTCKPVL